MSKQEKVLAEFMKLVQRTSMGAISTSEAKALLKEAKAKMPDLSDKGLDEALRAILAVKA